MHNSEIRAYAAALVDGEGTIALKRVYSRKSRIARYYPYTSVTNTDMGLLLFLQGNFGGSHWEAKVPKHCKRAYVWQIDRVDCKDFLRGIGPYLIAKKAQARLALACPLGRSGKDTTPSERLQMETIHKKIQILNRRGRRAEQLLMELQTQRQPALFNF